MTDPLLLLGDEAIARAALDAGIAGAYAYPGTPSTEILEYIRQNTDSLERPVHGQWSANEKTAMEEALGMAYCGCRSLVSMKHVGLNVAADPFVNSAITGVNGGLLLVVADDPSMHSSQNEQDSRFYGTFAGIPIFEPSTQQEAYNMVFDAFALSEEVALPIMMRITTKLAHSRADVRPRPAIKPTPRPLLSDPSQFTLLPANARRHYAALVEAQADLQQRAAVSSYNRVRSDTTGSLGILAAGIGYTLLQEVAGEKPAYPTFKLSQYPLPQEQVKAFCSGLDALLVIEEGMPLLEERLRGVLDSGLIVHGRLDGTLPRTGELSPDDVAAALGRPISSSFAPPAILAPRPPRLCKGCPHANTFDFLNEVMKADPNARVFADIGCYTLGALPPHQAIHTCVDMGASITMAKGAVDSGLQPVTAVIGDSTFTHSGMTGLLDCVMEQTHITVLILDNDTTAMTGGQPSMGTGARLEQICLGLGVEREHLRVVNPVAPRHADNVAVLREELAYPGVSVIIPRRPCIQILNKNKKKA